jgi:hypothetical protein
MKDSYLGIKYEESVNQNFLLFRFKNKIHKEITPLSMDFSVDDIMVQFLSGLPPTMQGNKSINSAFIIGPDTPIDNIEF